MLDEIEVNLRTILQNEVKLKEKIENISSESNLSDLGLNSVSIIKVIIAIEKHYNFDFEIEDLRQENMSSISNLAKVIEKYINN
ncbi:MAG: phosphopantetheine-binding protein [Ruminiclostridium sp.]